MIRREQPVATVAPAWREGGKGPGRARADNARRSGRRDSETPWPREIEAPELGRGSRLPVPSSRPPHTAPPTPPNTHTSRGRSGGGGRAHGPGGLGTREARDRSATSARSLHQAATRPPSALGPWPPSRSAPVTPRQKVSPFPPLLKEGTQESLMSQHRACGRLFTVSKDFSLLPSLALQELQAKCLFMVTACFSGMGVKELALSIPTDGDALWGPRKTLFLNPQKGAFPLWRLTRKSPTVAFAFCLFKFLRFPT